MRAELARRGIPQIEISRIIGISQRQVSERILGRVGFEARELLLIAKELGVSVEQLASLDDLAAIERAGAGAA